MESCRFVLMLAFATTLTTLVSSRAVNISNTWMLPEEGFPVFYRYFRDRISWYEADAVCQFHHANLVTADSTSQYDAIRAYLKELDITENVWIGLSKTAEKPKFAWTDFKPLSGEGHWQQAIPAGNDPLCVAMDPAADFLWKSLPCGGPEVASFICELPVPSWALGPQGCLLTELPSLTVLYIPEQMALELTSDCGLDGTKRIACKGNANREEILKQLTCVISNEDFDEKSSKQPSAPSSSTTESFTDDNFSSAKTTKPWIWTSNTIDIDYGMPTRHRRETEDTLSPLSTKTTTDLSTKESSKTKWTTEVTSISPSGDVTLDSSISQGSDKSLELKTTQVADLTTQDANTQTEMGETPSSTVESKIADAAIEDTAEYPSAINQGQLFSIIENGTMFDIIELNETTGTDESKLKEITLQTPQVLPKISTTSSTSNALFTTVIYNKEPPADTSFVTNKSLKKLDKSNKKIAMKELDPKKMNHLSTSSDVDKMSTPHTKKDLNALLENTQYDKTLSKEVELFPIVSNSLIKLNRTNRKELPKLEDTQENKDNLNPDNLDNGSQFGIPKILNFSVNNHLNNNEEGEHQHVEIKLFEKDNSTKTLFITTKRATVKSDNSNSKIETLKSDEGIQLNKTIDPKINLLNNVSESNNESETFQDLNPEKSVIMKEEFLPKSLLGETEEIISSTTSEDPIEAIPEAQPRPNRQRQLTRPQRRSFYPYFFSRVLG